MQYFKHLLARTGTRLPLTRCHQKLPPPIHPPTCSSSAFRQKSSDPGLTASGSPADGDVNAKGAATAGAGATRAEATPPASPSPARPPVPVAAPPALADDPKIPEVSAAATAATVDVACFGAGAGAAAVEEAPDEGIAVIPPPAFPAVGLLPSAAPV